MTSPPRKSDIDDLVNVAIVKRRDSRRDGTLSRAEVFCISGIPASSEEAVRRYASPVGFETCVGVLIQAEPKV